MLANGNKELRRDAKVKTIAFDPRGVLFTEGKSVALEVAVDLSNPKEC
ncbi:MAG: hypothetical protein QNJ30_19525 [Kiloniellales bacterium]|nr:hypothetical protein [Kiloniellales bacterium]